MKMNMSRQKIIKGLSNIGYRYESEECLSWLDFWIWAKTHVNADKTNFYKEKTRPLGRSSKDSHKWW